MKIIFSPDCLAYESAGHPESVRRVRASVDFLRQQPRHQFVTPRPCADEDLRRVHTARLLEQVKLGTFADADTPVLPGIYEHARRSAGAAIQAAELAWSGEPAFSLMRPPGHHATRDQVMGFCYFNNIAVAVARLMAGRNGPRRVAIVDFDCHHGNGTEDIFQGEARVLFVSLHQSPCYPGTGLRSEGRALNFPLPPDTDGPEFLAVLERALEKVRAFGPEMLAVSAGFDGYKRDPLTNMKLEIATFGEVGRQLAALKLPMFAVLEGGYSTRLPHCIGAFLDGWEGVGPRA
ncbi:MAG: histone deacetylase [Verrucomicrobiae bacterium]|nr:histone deacetylase [Verrucomicrobiae bacterium]